MAAVLLAAVLCLWVLVATFGPQPPPLAMTPQTDLLGWRDAARR